MRRSITTLGATAACVAASFGTPGTARADFTPFHLWPDSAYCANGLEMTVGRTTQHIAVGNGAMYIAGCSAGSYTRGETPFADAQIQQLKATPDPNGGWPGTTSFVDLPYAAAGYLSATATGKLWAVNHEPGMGIYVSLWNGTGWAYPSQVPGGRVPNQIAAVNDTTAYVLAPPQGTDSCPGGDCLWQVSTSGAASMVTLDGVTAGAIAIAYDAALGKLWRIDQLGHVWSQEIGWRRVGFMMRRYSYWFDRGEAGLAPANAGQDGTYSTTVAIAVYNDVPWVIGDSQNAGSSYVYVQNGAGTTWVQQPNSFGVTDIAVDPVGGAVSAIKYNGPSQAWPGAAWPLAKNIVQAPAAIK